PAGCRRPDRRLHRYGRGQGGNALRRPGTAWPGHRPRPDGARPGPGRAIRGCERAEPAGAGVLPAPGVRPAWALARGWLGQAIPHPASAPGLIRRPFPYSLLITPFLTGDGAV